jgi:hypothetical protein
MLIDHLTLLMPRTVHTRIKSVTPTAAVNATFRALIVLSIFAGGSYVNEYQKNTDFASGNSFTWFTTSSAEYGWPGDEIPAAAIIADDSIAAPVGDLQLQ